MKRNSLKSRIRRVLACVRSRQVTRIALSAAVLLSGCVHRTDPLHYPHDDPVEFYRDYSETINFPDVASPTPNEVSFSEEPHTLLTHERSEPWDMPLSEAVAIALQNNRVIRSAGQFLSLGNTLLNVGSQAPSVYDPAIQESGVLFGTRGVEAALADFDANFTTNMMWGRSEQIQNNAFFGAGLTPGGTLIQENAQFQAGLSKDFAYGGQLQLGHNVNYLWTNAPGQLFPSVYTGNVGARYRHPLLAGAGTEYTRIAGPITQSFGGISGVTQGVVIARINNDIEIADFQAAVRNLVKDVEDTYWELYLAYRNFDTAVIARNSALATWRFAKITVDIGGPINVADESQARDQYWTSEAAVKNARSSIYEAETRLRRLLGLPINEGRVIRPSDEPLTAQYYPDWEISLAEALTHRVELRKQKWNIKSLELQLKAARSLTRPRLDFVGNYQVNGFGDDLLGYGDADNVGTTQGLDNFYETLTQGNQTGWGLGFELTMPIGFRQAHAQVRNIELRLSKAREVLYVQEMEIAHELAAAFQELTRAYAAAEANFSRRDAAIENVRVYELQEAGGIITIDEVLRAQERRAQAENAFFSAIVDYNQALTNLHFRKGTLLEDAHVHLLEGDWTPEAYIDAYRRAQCRTGAVEVPCKHTEPPEFARRAPLGGVAFAELVEEAGPVAPPAEDEELQQAPVPAEGRDFELPEPPEQPDTLEPYVPEAAGSTPTETAPTATRDSALNQAFPSGVQAPAAANDWWNAGSSASPMSSSPRPTLPAASQSFETRSSSRENVSLKSKSRTRGASDRDVSAPSTSSFAPARPEAATSSFDNYFQDFAAP